MADPQPPDGRSSGSPLVDGCDGRLPSLLTDDHKSKKWKHLLVSPDLRYWTDSVNVHHFFGVNLIYSHYNVADVKFPFGLYKSVRNERRQGDLGALGIYYGYSYFWVAIGISRH